MGLLGSSVPGRAGEVAPVREPPHSPQRMPGGVTLVHSFEDWLGAYGGDTGNWNVGTTADGYQCVTDGQNGAGGQTGSLGEPMEIASTSGLNAYPEEGDPYRVDYRPVGDVDDHTWIGTYIQSETSGADGYWVKIYHDGWTELIVRNGDLIGEGTTIDSGDSGASDSSTDYTVEFIVEEGLIDARILTMDGTELLALSGSDSAHAPGGVAFGANTDASAQREVYVDYARVI